VPSTGKVTLADWIVIWQHDLLRRQRQWATLPRGAGRRPRWLLGRTALRVPLILCAVGSPLTAQGGGRANCIRLPPHRRRPHQEIEKW